MPKLVGDDIVEIDNSAAREDSIQDFIALIEAQLTPK
jgi:ribose 1,5-bisphosphokinase PhnN